MHARVYKSWSDHSHQLRRLLVGNVLCPCIVAVTYIHNILVIRRYYVLVEVTRKENKYTLIYCYPFVCLFVLLVGFVGFCVFLVCLVTYAFCIIKNC